LGAVLGGLVGGIFFGAVMAFSIDKRRRAMGAAVGDLPTGGAKAARRAADRGPIPTDPEIRAAAVRIATQQLDLLRPVLRRRFIVAMVLLLTFSVVGAVIESPWYLLYALVPALLLTSQWYLPRRIRRRIRLLSEGTNVFTE
jgi:Flp pilus assembly protein TadB